MPDHAQPLGEKRQAAGKRGVGERIGLARGGADSAMP
jgi:hypothetical protein